MTLKTVLNKVIVEPVEAEMLKQRPSPREASSSRIRHRKNPKKAQSSQLAMERLMNRWKLKWVILYYSANIPARNCILMIRSIW